MPKNNSELNRTFHRFLGFRNLFPILALLVLALNGAVHVAAQQPAPAQGLLGATYKELLPEQKALVDDWFQRVSVAMKKTIPAEEGYDNMPLSYKTTFSAITNLNQASTSLFSNSGNTYLTSLTNALLTTDNTGKVVSSTTIGSNLVKGTASSIFAFDQNGNAIATTSIGINYLALPTHIEPFFRGLVSSVDIIYFLIVAVVPLAFAAKRLDRLRSVAD